MIQLSHAQKLTPEPECPANTAASGLMYGNFLSGYRKLQRVIFLVGEQESSNDKNKARQCQGTVVQVSSIKSKRCILEVKSANLFLQVSNEDKTRGQG